MHLVAADLHHPHRGSGGRLGLGHLAAAALRRENRRRALDGGVVLASALLLVATPRLRHSPAIRLFADMRNFLGVPNTLNVLTGSPPTRSSWPGSPGSSSASVAADASASDDDISFFAFDYTGFYLLARFEGLTDRKVYSVNWYFISGHFLAMVTFILTVMLSFRNIKIASKRRPCIGYKGKAIHDCGVVKGVIHGYLFVPNYRRRLRGREV
ncbi:hypothetical protein ABZP36_025162 [Zizania latifolia]